MLVLSAGGAVCRVSRQEQDPEQGGGRARILAPSRALLPPRTPAFIYFSPGDSLHPAPASLTDNTIPGSGGGILPGGSAVEDLAVDRTSRYFRTLGLKCLLVNSSTFTIKILLRNNAKQTFKHGKIIFTSKSTYLSCSNAHLT